MEDEPFAGQVVCDQIKKLGHEIVAVASSGAEALHLYNLHKPQLVTMDVNLPGGVSGMEVAQTILRTNPKAVILLITSEPREKRLLEALKSGVKGYIEKPVHYQQLREIIDSLTDHYT